MVVVTKLYEFVKIYGITYVNSVDFTMSILYLNKPDFKENSSYSICIYTFSAYLQRHYIWLLPTPDLKLHEEIILISFIIAYLAAQSVLGI